MHGRSWALTIVVAAALACALPTTAAADPMPAGTYDLSLNGGSVQIGSFLPALPLPAAGPLPVTLNGQQVQLTLPGIATIPGTFSGTISNGTINGTYTINVPTATLSFDPATGSAQLDVALYGSFSVQVTVFGVSSSTTCTVGDATTPVQLHLTTAAGSPWSALTGNYGLADKTFVIPSPACVDPTIGSILDLLVGGTTAGGNSAQVTGNATRRPDAAPTTAQTPTTTATPPTQSQPTTTQTTPAGQPASCVVPKLKGKTLKQIKRSLKKAHCRLGKVKRVKAKKKQQKGKVLAQKRKAGKRLPAGTRVPVTVGR